jgi:hypothetical protein
MSKDRIGSACWYQVWDEKSRSWSLWKTGRLLAWSTDYIEGNDGFGNFPVGVIEDERTLGCVTTRPEQITFASIPPGPSEKKSRFED